MQSGCLLMSDGEGWVEVVGEAAWTAEAAEIEVVRDHQGLVVFVVVRWDTKRVL